MKINKSYNIQIWCGLKETYDNSKIHTLDDVLKICDEFVNDKKDCVSVTETNFRYVDGFEKGVVIGYINYPRFPRTFEEIEDRALELAEKLMLELNQYRVTVTTPRESFMLENDKIERQ